MRFFNTEGPVRSEDHYIVPPLSRWDLDEVLSLIDQKNTSCFMPRVKPVKPPVFWP